MLCGLCIITMALVVLSTCWPDELWGVSFGTYAVPVLTCTLSMRGVLAAFAMSYSCDCAETKISLTYCIYTYIYATALLLPCLCKSVGVLCYTAAMLLLCGCCCYAAVVLLLCGCVVVACR
jgi:hypothetical protein